MNTKRFTTGHACHGVRLRLAFVSAFARETTRSMLIELERASPNNDN
jgi:hypothetical protein